MADDSRFASALYDPRFRRPPKEKRKVKVDSRFADILKKSQLETLDKYGRKQKRVVKDEVSRYYDVDRKEDDEDDDEKDEDVHVGEDAAVSSKRKSKESKKGRKQSSDDDEEQEEEVKPNKKKAKKAAAPAAEEEKKGKKSKKAAKGKVSDDEDEEMEDLKTSKSKKNKKGNKKGKKAAVDDDSSSEDDEVANRLRGKSLQDAMKNWNAESSSDEGGDESGEHDDDDESTDFEVDENELAEEALFEDFAPPSTRIAAGDETKRLAIVDLDWDMLSATDILVILRSFLPSSGEVMSVKVYPSEFGKERLREEAERGPGRFIAGDVKKDDSSSDSDSDDDMLRKKKKKTSGEVDQIRLRKYEMDKLKYYYAIAVFDSVRTAMTVYDQIDGMEFEASSNVIDVRFVPDDMTFDDAPRDTATDIPVNYEPPIFVTQALQGSNVSLTWDRDDPKRSVLKANKHTGEVDYSQWLATSSEDDDEEAKEKDAQLVEFARSILKKDEEKAEKAKSEQMEVVFEPALSEAAEQLLEKKKKADLEKNETPWEKYQRKREEKKKAKKLARKQGHADDDDEDAEGDAAGAAGAADAGFDDDFFAQDVEFGQWSSDDEGPLVDEDGKKKKGGKADKKKGNKKELSKEELEARKKQEAELELLMMDDKEKKSAKGYSLKHGALSRLTEMQSAAPGKKNKKKGKKDDAANAKDDDNFKVDVHDPRFSAVLSDPKFQLDPLNPEFHKSSGAKNILDARNKSREKSRQQPQAVAQQPSKPQDVASLVAAAKNRIKEPTMQFMPMGGGAAATGSGKKFLPK